MKPFKVKCAVCKKTLELLKDSTEGQKVYCGDCFATRDQKQLDN